MADYRDTFTSEIYVNQSQAQDAVEKYTKKLEDLNKQLASIDKSQDGWEKKEKKLQRQIQSTERTLKTVQTGVQNYQKAMNNLDGRSIASLIKLKKQLNAEIKKLVPGTQEYIRLTQDFKKVEARIKSLTTATQSMSTRITGFFTKYWTMFDTLSKTITGLSMKFRQSAEDAAKLDDVYADVMKTTGLLHDEVQELDKALMKIDTRTSREQLLLLARDAGKLGIQGKENILGFVRAADQIQVALGEDLGEGAIRNLGKIADVLGYTQSMGIEKSLLSIASSINAVGQASTASEAYLVDFTQRLAGVAAQTGISAANIIGFASGLDQSAMKVEMASTAFQKFIMKLYEDPAKFAAYANLEVGKFTDLLKNDANQAIITILQALKDKDGFASLVPVFKDMGLDGARAVSVLAAMATNINAVTEAQALANVEFEKATSVTEEYRTKNNNLQAQLEKARKEFKNASIALGQSLNPVLLKSTKGVTYLIKALANYGKEIRNAAIAVAALTLAIKAKNIVEGVSNGLAKAHIVLTKTKVVVVNLLKLAYFKLTKQTEAAAIAQAALNGAMNASVFGLIATAIAGLTVAITRWVKKTREAAEANDRLAQAEKKANEQYGEEASKVRALTMIVENNNIALGERKKALEELKRIVPEYHAELTEEGRLINANRVAIDEYCKSLRQRIRLQAYKDELEKLEQDIIDKENERTEAEAEKQKALVEAGGDATETRSTLGGAKITKYGRKAGKVRVIDKELQALYDQEKEIGDKVAELTTDPIEEAIKKVKEEYGAMISQVSKENIDNPKAGAAEIKRLRDERDQKIAEIRKTSAATREVEIEEAATTNDALITADNKAADKRYQNAVENLRKKQRAEENILKNQFANNQISQEQYEKKMREINLKYLQEKVDLAKEYGEDETAAVSALLDAQIAANQAANQEIEALYKQRDDWSKAQQEEFERYMKELEEMKAEAEKVMASLHPGEARAKEMQNELDNLDKLHQAKLLSEEDYEEAVKQLRKKYADEDLNNQLGNIANYIEKANKLFEGASNFTNALKEAETAKLEAEFQSQLTAAGDNAEKREQIEAEYEEKQLELKKKYADVDMAISIAKTVANGAAAAVRAIADSGWVVGGIIAALIAATTAAEVATIVQQRNAIKNSSVNNASSSVSSSENIGQRTITGHADGGYTEDHTTLATVGEEGVEWIAPHWMVRDNPTTFANLERYRKSGIRGRKSLSDRGFADGGFSDGSIPGSAVTKEDIEAAVESVIIRTLGNNYIRAYVVRRDITELDDQDNRFKKQTSRG